MGVENGIRESNTGTPELNVGRVSGFFEEVVLHVLVEVSIVGVIDSFLKNTVASMLLGVCIVEGFQMIWRRWRNTL